MKGITPLKIEASKKINEISNSNKNQNKKSIINKKEKERETQADRFNLNREEKKISKTHKTKLKKLNNPPKKRNTKVCKAHNKSNRKLNYKKIEKMNSDSKIARISHKTHKNDIITTTKRKMLVNGHNNDNIIKNIDIIKINKKINEKSSQEDKKLDDFEINELEYNEAIELDKRQFHQIYWSILKRQHLILFTFFSWNDHNLWYIKFARFFFLICTDMAMNVFFFSDDSMHKIYLNYGKYDFIQQIPQIIYSTAISQLLELILCYLSLTDKHFYQIKDIKENKLNANNIFKILKCINYKLISFCIFTLILFAFYWYTVSTFCAVYQNTQNIFIKDSFSSFLTGLLYPFVLYLFPSLLRIIAIRDDKKKRLKFIYKLSDIIPIF